MWGGMAWGVVNEWNRIMKYIYIYTLCKLIILTQQQSTSLLQH